MAGVLIAWPFLPNARLLSQGGLCSVLPSREGGGFLRELQWEALLTQHPFPLPFLSEWSDLPHGLKALPAFTDNLLPLSLQ